MFSRMERFMMQKLRKAAVPQKEVQKLTGNRERVLENEQFERLKRNRKSLIPMK